MRFCLVLVPIALAASGEWTWAQRVPSRTSDLPTVSKPKPVEPKPDPDTDSEPDNQQATEQTAGTRSTTKAPDSGASIRKEDNSQDSASRVPENGPDYTGPSILSRGVNFTRPAFPSNERFRPFIGANFYRESGVSGKFQGPTSPVTQQSYTGADFNFGISGQHSRRYDTFELDYRGHAYVNGYSSQDHTMSLGYTRLLSRKLTAVLSETAGLYSNNFAVLNSVGATDTSLSNLATMVAPNTESFDDRTYYSTTQADLAYQKSSRLSFNLGSSGFVVKRDSRNLISANGYQARADAAYRATRRTTVGPYYAYSRYMYSGTFGDSGTHTVGVNYSVALSKRTQFRVRVGGSRLESRGLQMVALSPAVAQILGVATGTERFYAVSYLPDLAVDLSRSFRLSELSLSYVKGVSPGNGLVLTSRRDSVAVNYTYSGIRRYALSFGGGRDALGSVAQQIGSYSSYFGRASLSRSLPHDVQALLNFDYRKLGFTNNLYARNQYRVSVGFAFAPGAGPLKFW